MPRLIIGNDTKVSSSLTYVPGRTAVESSNNLAIQYYLRKKRSPKYLNFFKELDSSFFKIMPDAIQRILDEIRQEFPELGISEFPLGYVSKCYLGSPYEVHILDLKLEIVEHYKEYEPMPAEYEKARTLALNPIYELIEIYPYTMRAVTHDGEVSVI